MDASLDLHPNGRDNISSVKSTLTLTTLDFFLASPSHTPHGTLPKSVHSALVVVWAPSPSQKIKVASKIAAEYAKVKDGTPNVGSLATRNGQNGASNGANGAAGGAAPEKPRETEVTRIIQRIDTEKMEKARQKQADNRRRAFDHSSP